MPVETPRADYSKMLPKWKRLRDCFNGRDDVLAAGAEYVPDLKGQDKPGNEAYRARGNFFNALGRTVGGMNGAIFQAAPDVEIPTTFESLLDDITLTNVTFESFVTEIGKETVLMGRYGVLVDMPEDDPAQPRDASELRPYGVAYRAEDIINWRTERRGGDQVLTMVVLRECEQVSKEGDSFTAEDVEQFRVVMLQDKKCVTEIWREDKKRVGKDAPKFVKFKGPTSVHRRGDPLTFVPFIFCGALQPTPDLELPPLIDVADVNLGHWRNSVDYEYGLHCVALPTPWIAGGKLAPGTDVKFGPHTLWELEVNGSAGMVEFTGQGLGSIVVAMDEKKKQMATLGARLLEDAPSVSETASAVRLRHAGETATLRTIAQSLELAATYLLQICVWWMSAEKLPNETEVNVELNKEYLNIRATPQEVQVALTALQAGEISYETFYNILTTGGWAREGIDAATERKTIDTSRSRVPEPQTDPELSPGE